MGNGRRNRGQRHTAFTGNGPQMVVASGAAVTPNALADAFERAGNRIVQRNSNGVATFAAGMPLNVTVTGNVVRFMVANGIPEADVAMAHEMAGEVAALMSSVEVEVVTLYGYWTLLVSRTFLVTAAQGAADAVVEEAEVFASEFLAAAKRAIRPRLTRKAPRSEAPGWPGRRIGSARW